jgi:RimJ/RimL family protein N-acetyltransferase
LGCRLRWVASVRSPEDCAGFIRASEAETARGAQQIFGIVEQKTGALAGIASLQKLLETPGLAEASVWIRADRMERGYALEAGRLLIATAFKGDGLHRLYARIDPANRPARKVLQKLGFHYEGCLRHEKRLNGRWINQECWGLLRAEWKK